MRRTLKWFGICTLFVAVGFAAGTAFGFFHGLGAVAFLDAPSKGSMAVTTLKAMEVGKTETAKLLLETDIDNSLIFYSVLSEAWWFPAYSNDLLLFDPAENEKAIRRVATYRKAHPSPTRKDMFDKVPEGQEQYADEYREMALGIREHMRRLNETVEKYADK